MCIAGYWLHFSFKIFLKVGRGAGNAECHNSSVRECGEKAVRPKTIRLGTPIDKKEISINEIGWEGAINAETCYHPGSDANP